MVSRTRWRAWWEVPAEPAPVSPCCAPSDKTFTLGCARISALSIPWNVVDEPVSECSFRCIWILRIKTRLFVPGGTFSQVIWGGFRCTLAGIGIWQRVTRVEICHLERKSSRTGRCSGYGRAGGNRSLRCLQRILKRWGSAPVCENESNNA